MKSPYFIGVFFLFLAFGPLKGQEEEVQGLADPKYSIGGYVKNLQTLLFFNDAFLDLKKFQLIDTFLQDNLIHNRLNFKWNLNDNLIFKAEVRNRIFYGDLVRASPDYGSQIDNVNNDFFDLSLVITNSRSLVIHTMLDRLYLEYFKDNWEIRLGRQRINWGINNVWNPADWFNAFSFTDFDYEERPGADALSVKYYTGVASSVEVAIRAFDQLDEAIFAGIWKFNKWNYDFQALSGVVKGDLAFGVGWAGNIGNWGFKGEASQFTPIMEEKRAMGGAFSATLGLDYVFSNGIYCNFGYLFNSEGTTTGSITELFNFRLSARNLYPYKHAIFIQGTYPLSPLSNLGLAIIYSPVKVHPVFINPTFSYSLAENWDLDVVGQLVFNKSEHFNSPIQAAFLRMKYSF